MSQKNEMMICRNCAEMTMHISNPPNNLVHGIITLLCVGAWFPIWMIILAVQKNPQCTKCGRINENTPAGKSFGKFILISFGVLFCLGIGFCSASWQTRH